MIDTSEPMVFSLSCRLGTLMIRIFPYADFAALRKGCFEDMREADANTLSRGSVSCEQCAARSQGVFADLTIEDLRSLQVTIHDIWIMSGEGLYQSGARGEMIYTIRQGVLKLEQYMPDGSKRIVNLLTRGDLAGLEILTEDNYDHTAIALQSVAACGISKDVVLKLAPKLHLRLMKKWHDSMVKTQECLRELSSGSARQRVARLFLMLPGQGEERCQLFGREDVGALLGVTTETASRTIAEMKRKAVVTEVSPNVFARDRQKLESIATGRYRSS